MPGHAYDEGRVRLEGPNEASRLLSTLNASDDFDDLVTFSDIAAHGLLTEVLDSIIADYRADAGNLFGDLNARLATQLGSNPWNELLHMTVSTFPPRVVEQGDMTVEDYLEDASEGRANREGAIAVLVLAVVVAKNPAFAAFSPLFSLPKRADGDLLDGALGILENELGDLLWLLRAPQKNSPHSLFDQLDYVREHWPERLGEAFESRVVLAMDRMQEQRTVRLGGHGPPAIPEFRSGPPPAHYPGETDWMPNLVLIAKNAPVWLHQLGVSRLDEIPESALAELVDRGMNGLWLVGIWERSAASHRIKRRTGNPEALASAYSIYDYMVAADLGGSPALAGLRERANRVGLRLGADMVPNHTGLLSRWMIAHPEWFLQVEEPPFPEYSFTGPDLSPGTHIELLIEDGYWDQTNAAVVFRRRNRRSGEIRYIYHGNDGTQMPWNDTAQLDFRNADLRWALVETIIALSHRFDILRFDAAMTLTREHFQRLWFPQPGSGGAIPSRAEHGMSREAFEEQVPGEFWREVIDQMSARAPGTLLIAEAFWLTEPFFIDTLGMHRVYNSAFMHMLRDEETREFREYLRGIVATDPARLGRFINFMTTPDEAPAILQFGHLDKYFGVATLLATLPGTPLFGHGQIEGAREKYGMEFRQSYWEDDTDPEMTRRHETDIAPLLKRRHIFSGTEHFALLDFQLPDGSIDENVIAYSNRNGDEKALVVYNHTMERTAGTVAGTELKLEGYEAKVLFS
jgi:glycosidase